METMEHAESGALIARKPRYTPWLAAAVLAASVPPVFFWGTSILYVFYQESLLLALLELLPWWATNVVVFGLPAASAVLCLVLRHKAEALSRSVRLIANGCLALNLACLFLALFWILGG